ARRGAQPGRHPRRARHGRPADLDPPRRRQSGSAEGGGQQVMAQIVLDRLAAQFHAGEIIASGTEHGDEWARIRRDAWVAVATFLRDDPATKMEMFIDLTGVDRSGGGVPGAPAKDPPRFDVVVHLYSVSLKHRVRP